jgi:hypothetical protein
MPSTPTTPRETTNYGRLVAYQTFRETLLETHGRSGISELAFRDAWLARMRRDPRLYESGWYVPPPCGLAVLFGRRATPERITFHSLRDEASWPSDAVMHWKEGLLYAYCSPVDNVEGLPGDFALTLYFGADERLRKHFRNCYAAVHEVLAAVAPTMEARELFDTSQRVFARRGLENAVVSSTDTVSLDLGHTLPALDQEDLCSAIALSADARQHIRQARRFISSAHGWQLGSAEQITIEPQLISVADPSLPQISFHYVVVLGARPTILDECDDLFRMFELIP